VKCTLLCERIFPNLPSKWSARKSALENFYALRAEARNLQEMSLEEINDEIQSVREKSKA